mmetsp:Transcript_26314/g.76729  ORF Transcript_26314/g.76729 Transcript_26314/m.76729 type:complete len:214 (-) Transcript_26314:95-736(-)
MNGLEGQVEEERVVCTSGLLNERYRPVGVQGRRVLPGNVVLGGLSVVPEVRARPLNRLPGAVTWREGLRHRHVQQVVASPSVDAVEGVEAPILRQVLGGEHAQVPFPNRHRRIPQLPELLRQELLRQGKSTRLRAVDDRVLEAIADRVAPSHQHGPAWGAGGPSVEVVQHDASLSRGDRLEIWGVHGVVVPTYVSKALVIHQHHDHIGRRYRR